MTTISSIISQLWAGISDCDREIAYIQTHYPAGGYNPDDWGERMTAQRYASLADTSSLEEQKRQLQQAIALLKEQERQAIDLVCRQQPNVAQFVKNPAMARI